MTTRGILSIAELARINDTARYVYDVIKKGPLKVMPLGDSLMAGADGSTSMSGLRLPIFTLWHLLGVPVTSVGDIFGTAADNRYLYNTLGQGGTNAVSIKFQAEGGKTTRDLLRGTSNLSKLSSALSTHKPHIVMGCIGTNDTSPGDDATYKELIQTIQNYNKSVPIVFAGTPDSGALTTDYYDVDNQRADIRKTFRDACLAYGATYSDPTSSIGLFNRYPTTGYTTDHLNASGIFYDGTHLKQEGSAYIACGMFANMFGLPITDVMDLLMTAGPYRPVEWSYGADVSSTTAVMVASGPRKNTLEMVSFWNQDGAATATVTIGKRRISQDGSTTSNDTVFMTKKLAANTSWGWVPPDPKNPPRAWTNEGWYVTTDKTVNVVAFGHQVLN